MISHCKMELFNTLTPLMGVHYMDANRKGILVGPIEISGTLYVQGDLNVLNDIDITGHIGHHR
jgi:hypothetical protein